MKKRILVVEDDEAVAVGLREGLAYDGYEVTVAGDGSGALNLTQRERFDLVILDLMLPRLGGVDVCRELRARGDTVPIIMLTARTQELDKAHGLRAGADDYVTKPFSYVELLARVQAHLRRAVDWGRSAVSGVGGVRLDTERMQAWRNGRALDLTPREYRVLEYLVENRHRAVTRDELLRAVWQVNEHVFTRAVDVTIAQLRKKLEGRRSEPKVILTIHGVGYRFVGAD